MSSRRLRAPRALRVAGAVFLAAALIPACRTDRHTDQERAPEPVEAPPLVLVDLAGAEVRPLLERAAPAVCLFLVRVDCPISNRYAPEVQRLAQRYADTADCWLVYSDPDEGPAEIRAHVEDYGYLLPALRDPEQVVAALSGARVTPEVAVFGPERRLVYAGRIDDRFVDFGRRRAAPTTRELERVLAALSAGEAPTPTRVEAVGCPLPELER